MGTQGVVSGGTPHPDTEEELWRGTWGWSVEAPTRQWVPRLEQSVNSWLCFHSWGWGVRCQDLARWRWEGGWRPMPQEGHRTALPAGQRGFKVISLPVPYLKGPSMAGLPQPP